MRHLILACVLMAAPAAAPYASPVLEKGVVHFEPLGDQKNIPERYRLGAHEFTYELEKKRDLPLSGLEIHYLRFPSPVTTDCPENNTVFAEYYRPQGPGPFPGVIVLDITAGNQDLSRLIANCLAQNKIAALFVQMAYYGPRRPPGSKRRMMSTNFPQTIENVRQTVLDVRRATAWLAARPEVDAKRLGIHGTSLGSMVGALTAEMEPRLGRVCVLLGGAGLVDAYYDHPQAAPYRKLWEAVGGTKEQVKRLLAPIDPITCAANLKDRKVLLIAGKLDDIMPPKATEALWKAAGEPKLVWFNCSHYGAAVFIGPIMELVVKHFQGGSEIAN
ncbi:MAG TPA: prolyl oligopeptidase family serine peptidase [Gemmataceae bacterium]|nr:prolyl oligopeptidase family serine peptidase [Gemmataceae bacterium]